MIKPLRGDEDEPLSMLDVIDYWKKIAESDYAQLWNHLYSYINDWSFAVATDESTPVNEVRDRQTIYHTLEKVMDIMIKLEKEARDGIL